MTDCQKMSALAINTCAELKVVYNIRHTKFTLAHHRVTESVGGLVL